MPKSEQNSRCLCAILFCDLAAFSTLTETQLRQFHGKVVPGLHARIAGELPSPDPQKNFFVNSWGDAFMIVSDEADRLARVAIHIKAHFSEGRNRPQFGDIPETLKPRIALHASHVEFAFDPFLRCRAPFGKALTHAARLEPAVIPGYAFATPPFCELLADANGEFALDAIEEAVECAKGWGKVRVRSLRNPSESPFVMNSKAASPSGVKELVPDESALVGGGRPPTIPIRDVFDAGFSIASGCYSGEGAVGEEERREICITAAQSLAQVSELIRTGTDVRETIEIRKHLWAVIEAAGAMPPEAGKRPAVQAETNKTLCYRSVRNLDDFLTQLDRRSYPQRLSAREHLEQFLEHRLSRVLNASDLEDLIEDLRSLLQGIDAVCKRWGDVPAGASLMERYAACSQDFDEISSLATRLKIMWTSFHVSEHLSQYVNDRLDRPIELAPKAFATKDRSVVECLKWLRQQVLKDLPEVFSTHEVK